MIIECEYCGALHKTYIGMHHEWDGVTGHLFCDFECWANEQFRKLDRNIEYE